MTLLPSYPLVFFLHIFYRHYTFTPYNIITNKLREKQQNLNRPLTFTIHDVKQPLSINPLPQLLTIAVFYDLSFDLPLDVPLHPLFHALCFRTPHSHGHIIAGSLRRHTSPAKITSLSAAFSVYVSLFFTTRSRCRCLSARSIATHARALLAS